ncbi:uncharacterized protein LOC131402212 isoform X4 [Diceros bicornis minor]|uniref:uncharacterized protein LOC131402212 isoform X4 n=1 Tax=Diceros bicornis minor TaxID=77932 RepID=UPI0026EECB10|nr:uncharacterized protein LOC131402212 isoform X4 [Diceros bicornis minor]
MEHTPGAWSLSPHVFLPPVASLGWFLSCLLPTCRHPRTHDLLYPLGANGWSQPGSLTFHTMGLSGQRQSTEGGWKERPDPQGPGCQTHRSHYGSCPHPLHLRSCCPQRPRPKPRQPVPAAKSPGNRPLPPSQPPWRSSPRQAALCAWGLGAGPEGST